MQPIISAPPLASQILVDYEILDTPREQAFDDAAFIAAQICGAPIALISLIDRDRQWFKARIGIESDETPLDSSVCRIELEQSDLLVIPDLAADPRTRANPLVTEEPHARFYAGAALCTDEGVAIGRLCVLDNAPRPGGLTPEQEKTLRALARQVMVQLEQRRAAHRSAEFVRFQASLIAIGDRIRESASVTEMTKRTSELIGSVLDVDRAAYGTVDAKTETVEIAPDWTVPGIASIAGVHRFADFGQIRDELAAGEPLVINDVDTDPRTAADPAPMHALDIGALVNMPVRERGTTVAVVIVQTRGPRRWRDTELALLRSVADRLEAGVARLKSEERQQVLNQEISHRLKNTLAMVQAIATQTLRRIADREPVEAFERRLLALAGAHNVLMQTSWSSAMLADVLRDGITQLGLDSRFSHEGPPVVLGAKAALAFSLLVHELTTNAIKYGALSHPTGMIAVDWTISEAGGSRRLELSWRERGGPEAVAPVRKGFGSRLIQLGLLGTGGVVTRYPPEGFEASISADIKELVDS